MNKSYFQDKCILVTGSCGTIGSELVHQCLEKYGVKKLIGIDNNETELFFLGQRYLEHKEAKFYLADIRDPQKLYHIMQGVDIIFHAAAYKHVAMCEISPFEAVQTNILGVKNIISAAAENGVGQVIFTSSDKAANPTNVMGTSKLMGERLITAANQTINRNGTIFASTRFGNVLGSNGSVIPIFREQIREGKPITLTDPQMTRFIMSIPEAVQLVINTAQFACGGEVFVTKMPVIRIQDLAEVMIEELAPQFGKKPEDIEIKVVGIKPGEKLYEELMTDEETSRTVELEHYFSVLPALRMHYGNIEYSYDGVLSEGIDTAYNSRNATPLTKSDLRDFLIRSKLIKGLD
ncbi:SDR family NAD(P)-dependent oxidoreductase [Pseudodesulfovibrio methanolicus]|uniref:SDR family NAD(P)-dependent oxidoreductase n=1 Tax=Pseudodesulfovibrio methanolicus TaxID=3126690 RepID=A0ABZ2J101_9BACT